MDFNTFSEGFLFPSDVCHFTKAPFILLCLRSWLPAAGQHSPGLRQGLAERFSLAQPCPRCPPRGGAARGQQRSLPALPVEQQPWYCCSLDAGQGMVLLQNLLQKTPGMVLLQNLLHKTPNRQWDVPCHGWFLGGFGGWFWFFVWFSLVCFGFFAHRFWSRTRGLLACWCGQRHTLVLWNSCLALTATELKS